MARALFAGLMSGTSLDGVDAALVEFSDETPRLIAAHYLPYPEEIRARCLALQTPGNNELDESARLAQSLVRLYADGISSLLASAGVAASAITALGCHGQTVRHNPAAAYSIQLNDPALLAELTGIAVVADFRSRDLAAGGQGAPLVPAFHEAMFRSEAVRRVVVNIGGIANLTDLPPGAPTRGFDCGPGNMLMDAWIGKLRGDRFDRDGAWARSGRVLPELLSRLWAHPFFARQAPKSCGREEFNLVWLDGLLAGDERPEDVAHTLLELTAQGIHSAIGAIDENTEVFVCGGGAHNGLLMERLAALMPQAKVQVSDALGVDADWMEAMAFAWLARQTWLGRCGNLPAVTGARGARVLGAIYPA